MITIDYWLLGLLAAFVLYGLRLGLIHMLGSFLGLILGVFVAGQWYQGFSTWVAGFFSLDPLVAQVLGFGMLTALFNRLVGLLFTVADKLFRIVRLIPGLGTIDRLGGAALGLFEGLITIGVTLYLATKLNLPWSAALEQSAVVPFFLVAAQAALPLLPQALKSVQSII
ncbi:MAG: CvpA family protein [Candidatus Kerfeldbacteria bacterium]|nr:CvpA family protein [Candidatus Kerfeldbacteria bacterium]